MSEKEFFHDYCKFVESVTSDSGKSDLAFNERLSKISMMLNGNFARMDMAVNGLAGEAGEVADLWKKIKFHGKDFSEEVREEMIKELGDLFWYLAQASMALDIPMDEIMLRNEAKLKLRHPHGFSGKYLK